MPPLELGCGACKFGFKFSFKISFKFSFKFSLIDELCPFSQLGELLEGKEWFLMKKKSLKTAPDTSTDPKMSCQEGNAN